MDSEEHKVIDLTTKVSAWMANLIAIGIVAIVSSHIWILIQVTSIQGKLTSLDGLYTNEKAETAKALQELTDAKQNNEIAKVSNKADITHDEMNKIKTWLYNLQKKGKLPEE
jgi:hypothetical protein